ncbi:hypothetical protein [Cohnella cholangitidis]|uniref:Uncharacterized protein n=1 Tax=Cohnella cholangitidis TaxID=2598458 RepID=A0A7G5C664_9BACL|nr:hypothetical protein [Cohnella cholangitidis]QMV44698.1 hypothetical protein FPL14_28655 [Cohnella cholangitidis]
MTRLRNIAFVFPSANESEQQWNRTFNRLIAGIPSVSDNGIPPSSPSFSDTALPNTGFRTGSQSSPAIVLETDRNIQLKVGNILIKSAASGDRDQFLPDEGIESPVAFKTTPIGNTIFYLHEQLQGHIIGIDHTGVNVPVVSTEPSEWNQLISGLSGICNLYRYPGQQWPFIIPADSEEFEKDITRFDVKRTPKFELVYDQYADKPIFQFALETNLTKEQLESMFPEPHGFSIPSLAHIFRSIFVQHPWEDELSIRFDLYYRPASTELTDWATGEWLVREGGRVNS